MKISEAIEEQVSYLNDPFHDSSERFREAVLLGIEALKRISVWRGFLNKYDLTILEGETKE